MGKKHIHQELSRIIKNYQELSRIIQNYPESSRIKLSRIIQNHPESSGIIKNYRELSRIIENCQEFSRIIKNSRSLSLMNRGSPKISPEELWHLCVFPTSNRPEKTGCKSPTSKRRQIYRYWDFGSNGLSVISIIRNYMIYRKIIIS